MLTRLTAAPAVLVLLALALPGPVARAQGELVIVKEGTKEYHRPGCAVIRDGQGVLAMTRAQAEGRGFKAHPGCDPAKQERPGEEKAGPVYVYVDGAGKLYHRETCKRLGKDRRKVTLDEDLARKYWPCPTCKPPIRKRPGTPR